MMLTQVAKAAGTTTLRRLRAGPAFPGWSFSFEASARLLKNRAKETNALPFPQQRLETDRQGDEQARRFRGQVQRAAETLGGVPGEWFVPPSPVAGRTILYLHGGGFVAGSSRTHAEPVMRFAIATHARIFVPNYRLAPEHRHPTQLEDAQRVYSALLDSGVRPAALAVMGDSAGGTLTAQLVMALRDAGRPLPAKAAMLSPWVDPADRTGSMKENARYDWAELEDFDAWMNAWLPPGADPRDPAVCLAQARWDGLPPLWLEVGTAEMLLDQVRALAAKLRTARIPFEYREHPGMVHDSFILAGFFPPIQAAVDELAAWLTREAPSAPR